MDRGKCVVVNRQDFFGPEKLRRLGRVGRPHREAVTDRQAGEIDGIKLAEQFHITEEGGVTGEINRAIGPICTLETRG